MIDRSRRVDQNVTPAGTTRQSTDHHGSRTSARMVSGRTVYSAQYNPSALSSQDILALQRSIGNQAVLRLIASSPERGEPPSRRNRGDTNAMAVPAEANNSPPIQTEPRFRSTTSGSVIQRKLAGTGQALLEIGGEPSLKSKRKAKLSKVRSKVVPKPDRTKKGGGKYAQLLARLHDYETKEAKLAMSGRPLKPKQKVTLLKELRIMEDLAGGWLQQNQDSQWTQQDVKQKQEKIENQWANTGVDYTNLNALDELAGNETDEQRRAHGIRLLLVRLRHETREIGADRFHKTKLWSDETLDRDKTRDDAFGGKINRLDKVVHKGENKEGVFIWDRSWDTEGTAGKDLGIPDVDPMAGARSVAMYQLAKLLKFDLNVIARTEFATHSSDTKKKGERLPTSQQKFGIRMEMAPGREAAQTPAKQTAHEAGLQGQDVISLEDPVLQRALNALQLIDAIAGQLDRHWHNYYIATDGQGNVTGVVGIDLDMAFAKQHHNVDKVPVDEKGTPVTKSNFVGMPHLVDEQFARAIIGLDEKDLETMLRAYLEPEEVSSALERFRIVQDACRKLQGTPRIISTWDASTSLQQRDQSTSYLGKMNAGIISKSFSKKAMDDLKATLGETGVFARNTTKKAAEKIINDRLFEPVLNSQLTVSQGKRIVDEIRLNFLASPLVWEEFSEAERAQETVSWLDRELQQLVLSKVW